jgi:CRISPR-associated protein Csa3
MRLAITLGFESNLVIRAVARLPRADDYVYLRAQTGTEGGVKSAETATVIKALGRGRDFAVDVRDLARGIEQLASLDFDAVASQMLSALRGSGKDSVRGEKVHSLMAGLEKVTNILLDAERWNLR